MNIRIVAITDSDKHFSTAIAEYLKRLGKTVELVDIKPVKNGTHLQIITKETALIKDKIQTDKNKGRTIVLLSKE
ncbi:23S rRNA (pseudouridine(1915)-N(3))-methyltransferase RlmH [Patescibacteria group bacterium]|nr:23S rRNA (pseudouridine(1915)-N(3))-methyltransferase RlmH [Patescibacteria group bacterium]